MQVALRRLPRRLRTSLLLYAPSAIRWCGEGNWGSRFSFAIGAATSRDNLGRWDSVGVGAGGALFIPPLMMLGEVPIRGVPASLCGARDARGIAAATATADCCNGDVVERMAMACALPGMSLSAADVRNALSDDVI